jgi:hypothetical protein
MCNTRNTRIIFMSNLLEQASLVMIPSGYKEDVVYSEIPINGAGDLSFTRASNGTRINSQGLVEVVPWNLLQESETFSNAVWTKQDSSITANATTAPNGTLTADKLVENTSTSAHSVWQANNLPNQTYTYSFYAKASERVWVYTRGDIGLNYFNVSTGVVGTTSAGATSTIENVGNGWYRCIVTKTFHPQFNTQIAISTADNIDSYTGNGTSGIFLWGAQLNIGSTAKPYFPTTDRLNVPRLTYQNGGGGCPSLLLEKQSTNYILQSQNFTTFWSFANLLYTANQAISPDGTQNATKLDNTTGTGQHRYFQLAFTGLTNETISFSIYAKQGTHRYISWGITDDSNYRGQVVVDLQTGTITDQFTASATLSNLSVVSQGNGWYRISGTVAVSANYAGGNAYGFGLMLNSASWSTASYTGTETYFYGWGAQAELSSYPTSYIPTTSSSATRVADVCTKNGIGALIGGTSGTVFFDIKTNPVLSSANYKQFCYYFTSGGAQSYMYLNSANQLSTNSNWGSFVFSATPLVANTRYKIALVYAPNDFALYVNGVSVATASSGTPNNNADITIGQLAGTEYCEFVFNQYIHFPSRLTNAELSALTTI